MNKGKWTVAMLGVTAAVCLFIYVSSGKATQVKVCTADTKDIYKTVQTEGYISAKTSYSPCAPASGKIKKIYVKENDMVKQGDPLFTLSNPLLEAEVEQARLEYEYAKNASAAVFSDYAASQQLALNIQLTRLRLESLEEQLRVMTACAEIDGRVLKCSIKEGEYASAGMPLMRIADTESYYIQARLWEGDAPQVKRGQKVFITIENKNYTGTVEQIEMCVNTNQTFMETEQWVTAHILADQQVEGVEGMRADVEIITDQAKNAICVSQDAIIREGGYEYIYIIVDNKACKTRVQTGLGDDFQIQVLNIKKGIKAALNPRKLTHGEKVRVID